MVCNQQNWKSCLELKKIYDADVTMTTLCDVTVTQFNGKQFYFSESIFMTGACYHDQHSF